MTSKNTKKRPAWLSDAHPAEDAGGDDAATRVLEPPASAEAAGAADSRAAAPDAVRSQREEPRFSGHLEGLGSLTGRARRRLLAAGLAALALLIVLYGARMLPFFGSTEESDQDASSGQAARYYDAAPSGVEGTGVVFGGLKTEDDVARLEGAGLKWEGKVEADDTGETITLKGPTAVQIRRGFEMPRSSIQSGVFAVAQDGGEVLHVTFHTFDAAGTEVTQGSIFAVEDERLDFTGYYRDERQRGSEKVVRTYMPPGGEDYRVSFKVPKGTPVPLLVGFRGVS